MNLGEEVIETLEKEMNSQISNDYDHSVSIDDNEDEIYSHPNDDVDESDQLAMVTFENLPSEIHSGINTPDSPKLEIKATILNMEAEKPDILKISD